MLATFKVENFMSLDKRVEFSMYEQEVLLKYNILDETTQVDTASLITAIATGAKIITHGMEDVAVLNYDKITPTTLFSYEIVLNKHTYNYGFRVNFHTNKIVSEWLYQVYHGELIPIYELEFASNQAFYEDDLFFDYGNQAMFKKVVEHCVSNVEEHGKLVLPQLAQLGDDVVGDDEFDVFNDLFTWFKSNLIVVPPCVTNESDICNSFFACLEEMPRAVKDFEEQMSDMMQAECLKCHYPKLHQHIKAILQATPNPLDINFVNLLRGLFEVSKLLIDHEDFADLHVDYYAIKAGYANVHQSRRLMDVLDMLFVAQDYVFIVDDLGLDNLMMDRFMDTFCATNANTAGQLIVCR
ncbi:MAG: hypothetical protein BEN18_02705 [Epulopiscium sp. Nuni2H_MBin001]|nr:MAG: hypothetical protein BEN18_02705 [Epulopiscium sp. Nuni2H_MBin001]